MKLDEVAIEAGFDISSDAILLRAEQLSKSEVFQIQTSSYRCFCKLVSLLTSFMENPFYDLAWLFLNYCLVFAFQLIIAMIFRIVNS